jgi:hypothetical protein
MAGSRARVVFVVSTIASLAALSVGGSAGAFDLIDGKIQIHGYYENQVRSIAKNYNWNDGWDVSAWQNIVGIETDLNFAPNGIGPFDLIHGFIRLEERFDCIWYQCGGIHGINAWGNDAEKFPTRNTEGRKAPWTGTLETGDDRRIHSIPLDQLGYEFKDSPVNGNNVPAYLWHVPGVDTLFGIKDPLQTPSLQDDPAFYVFGRFVRPHHEYRFALRRIKGQPNGSSVQVMGPFFPENDIQPLAALADIANPFNPMDENPVLVPAAAQDPSISAFGSTALPFRPAPLLPAGRQAANGDGAEARGLFIPNEQVAKLMRHHEFDDFDQNFRQNQLAWNIGASQQPERELKEAYLDMEMFDSRLWIRAGKQNIVWGKTELFRTTDQFNPQDLALATLASLEESRIALWSIRGVYSFYSVGPLEDVRLELAANFDQFEPNDLGRCGEPYTPNPVCDKSAGLFAHGIAGTALAGEVRPPNPWNDPAGLEGGVRLEFRWERYSFALTDFWGYDDFPYVSPQFYYSRNVDPVTGRPRRGQSLHGCDPDDLNGGDTSGCLGSGADALHHSSANQQRFALINAASIGFSSLDRSVGAQSVFNSNAFVAGAPLVSILGTVLSGSTVGRSTIIGGFFPELAPPAVPVGQGFPIVRLNHDANDGAPSGPFGVNSLSYVLTDQQEALLGCGAFWNTSCDGASPGSAFGGIDLLNSELSVLIQSWPGFPGTAGAWATNFGPSGPIQPGTIRDCTVNPVACAPGAARQPFMGGAVASRFEQGRFYTLPGARSPFPEASMLRQGPVQWDPNVDGCVRAADPGCAGAHDLRHPYSNDYFMTELGAFSWNYMLLLIAFSQNDPPGLPGGKPEVPCQPGQNPNTCRLINEFVSNPLYYLRTDGCSYAAPQFCSNIQAIYSIAHTTRRSVRAGGTGDFGRTDFDWHQGGVGVLKYNKRNVAGFSMDFAEDHTKSNWGIESTWIQGVEYEDNDEIDRLSKADQFNLTVSIDRPTFINFLNPGRTFFFNTQIFMQYIAGYNESFTQPGPWNVLGTFHIDTGYFKDRLLPGITFVWDFQSESGAILPEIQYRFTPNLSTTLTLGVFSGRFQSYKPPIRSIADFPYRAGQNQGSDWSEQGLSPVRDNDEIALRVRYTF